jgi:hypothetical protein
MALVTAAGASKGVSMPVPSGSAAQQATPDAFGFLLFSALSGAYDVTPTGSQRVTTGAVLAIGPTRWLVGECDDLGRCSLVVIDRVSGARRRLAALGNAANFFPVPGVISPDGAMSALVDPTSQTPAIHVRDLTSGADHLLAVPIDPSTSIETLVWSPDSQWLFVANANGGVSVVDARTRQVRDLGNMLPTLSQIAIRAN